MHSITWAIILLNAAIFAVMSFLPHDAQVDAFHEYGFSVENVLEGKWWTPVTAVFLHGNLAHLALNTIALFFFGGIVEANLSRRRFLTVYLLGGLAGNVGTALAYDTTQLSVGASGAIFALMGSSLLVKPFEFVTYPFIIPVPVILVAALMIISNVLLFIAPPDDSNIAFAAHIGGFVAGLAYGLHVKGLKKSLLILVAAVILFFLLAPYLRFLLFFDYTQAIGAVSP